MGPRLFNYRSREGRIFAFAEELDEKRRVLAELEKELSLDVHPLASGEAAALEGLAADS